LHANGICHRDLKPENLLCVTAEAKEIKVIDFGLSKDFFNAPLNTKCGSLHYAAPEILDPSCENYDNSIDIWSIGVICFILLVGYYPWTAKDDHQLFKQIKNVTFSFSHDWDGLVDAKKFITRLLVKDPKQRPSATDCLQDPWFDSSRPKGKLPMARCKSFEENNTERKINNNNNNNNK